MLRSSPTTASQRQRYWISSTFALFASLGACILLGLFAHGYPFLFRQQCGDPITAENLAQHDGRLQIICYAFTILFMACIVLIAVIFHKGLDRMLAPKIRRFHQTAARNPFFWRYAGFLVCAQTLLLGFASFRTWYHMILAYLKQGTFASMAVAAGIVASLLSVCWAIKHMGSHALRWCLWTFMLAYLTVFVLQGIKDIPQIPRDSVPAIESHFSNVMGQADQLAVGQRWFQDAMPFFGMLFHTMLGIFQRCFGMLDLAGHVYVLRGFQILFCLLALVAFRLWKPTGIAALVVPVLMLVPTLQIHGNQLFYPNLTAWRFLDFALGMVVLLLIRKASGKQTALILGFSAGCFVLMNTETGLCITAGYAAFLFTRWSWKAVSGTMVNLSFLALGFGTALILFFIFLKQMHLIAWDHRTLYYFLFLLSNHFSGQYDGFPLSLDILAVLIFFHAGYIAVRSTILMGRGSLGNAQRIRLAIAVTILAWFTHHINKSLPEYLWTYLFLYTFLLMDNADPRKWRIVKNNIRGGIIPISIVLPWCVVLPYLLNTNFIMAEREWVHRKSIHRPADSGNLISGCQIPEPVASALKEKANFLSEESRKGPLLYFSSDSYLMLLMTHKDNRLPLLDAVSLMQFDRYWEWIRGIVLQRAPKNIWIDAPDPALPESHTLESYRNRIRNALQPLYRKAETSHGWEIWERV